MIKFNFNDLFVFDLANNHQGDVKHALNIIESMGKVTSENEIKGALKFQFRDIDTLIHPDYKGKKDIPHIPRFVSTKLSKNDYKLLANAVQKNGMITIATPFDEVSLDLIVEFNIEIIKIASCSSFDWPLLKEVALIDKPVIISTAGLSLSKIDQIVYFFKQKRKEFALMHCVALYPTDNDFLHLNQIELLKNRYPDLPIGFSTHEHPDNYNAVRIAYAKGARIFERHVGLKTDKYKLNTYSSQPKQIDRWIKAYKETVEACGGEYRGPAFLKESESLKSLMRGVYAKKNIEKGKSLRRDKVFFAMPLLDGQLKSSEWKGNLTANKSYKKNEPINESIADLEPTDDELIAQIILQVKGMLNNANITISGKANIEISHHYGLERFREFGAVIIDCINREYCKKLIIQLPRQKHPYHRHMKKEETFQLLFGDMEMEINGKRYKVLPGDTILVKSEDWHKFHTLDGAIVEEVSTTHYNDDSYYDDERIIRLPRKKRKTKINNWDLL